MSKSRITLVITAAALFWFALSADQSADAQVTIQFGRPGYYGNQPVYRGNNVTLQRRYYQPNYGYVQPYSPYLRTFSVSPQRFSSGYRGYSSQLRYGNVYESYRPSYTNRAIDGNRFFNRVRR